MSNAEEIAEEFIKQFSFTPRAKIDMADELLGIMQAHTNQALQELKERVEEMEKEAHDKYMKEYGSSDAEAFVAGRLEGISDIIETIEDMQH